MNLCSHHKVKSFVNLITLDADPMVLARGTPGFSGADLQNMVKWVPCFLSVTERNQIYCVVVKPPLKLPRMVH